jgi:hypothetical protein
VSIAGDCEWIATIDNDVALWVANQKERHRHVDAADLKRAAAEQVEHDASRHTQIVWALALPRRWRRALP